MLAILFTLAWAITGGGTIQSDSPEVREIHRLEAVWNVAHLRGDVPALDAICATDLTVNRWQFTKTYANEDGRWVLVAYHASEGPK